MEFNYLAPDQLEICKESENEEPSISLVIQSSTETEQNSLINTAIGSKKFDSMKMTGNEYYQKKKSLDYEELPKTPPRYVISILNTDSNRTRSVHMETYEYSEEDEMYPFFKKKIEKRVEKRKKNEISEMILEDDKYGKIHSGDGYGSKEAIEASTRIENSDVELETSRNKATNSTIRRGSSQFQKRGSLDKDNRRDHALPKLRLNQRRPIRKTGSRRLIPWKQPKISSKGPIAGKEMLNLMKKENIIDNSQYKNLLRIWKSKQKMMKIQSSRRPAPHKANEMLELNPFPILEPPKVFKKHPPKFFTKLKKDGFYRRSRSFKRSRSSNIDYVTKFEQLFFVKKEDLIDQRSHSLRYMKYVENGVEIKPSGKVSIMNGKDGELLKTQLRMMRSGRFMDGRRQQGVLREVKRARRSPYSRKSPELKWVKKRLKRLDRMVDPKINVFIDLEKT